MSKPSGTTVSETKVGFASATDRQEHRANDNELGSALGSTAWMVVARPYLKLAKSAQRRLLPLNLGLTSALILSRLAAASEPQRMSDLASFVEVEPQSITSLVDRLERVGFVRREKHPSDRRAILLVVTESGLAAAERIEQILSETLRSEGISL